MVVPLKRELKPAEVPSGLYSVGMEWMAAITGDRVGETLAFKTRASVIKQIGFRLTCIVEKCEKKIIFFDQNIDHCAKTVFYQ